MSDQPLGPEMEADYQRRRARFEATFEKKRQEAEAMFKRYEAHFRHHAIWPNAKVLRQTRWYHNLSDRLRAYFDRKIDEMEHQTECPDCGRWYESWEVNEHIARDHYGQDDAQ